MCRGDPHAHRAAPRFAGARHGGGSGAADDLTDSTVFVVFGIITESVPKLIAVVGYWPAMFILMAIMLLASTGTGAGFAPESLCGCVGGVGLLVFTIWEMVLLSWYRREFAREAEAARSIAW